MSTKDQDHRAEIANEVFHGIPSPHKRAKMSPEELAIILSTRDKDSAVYILLSHELNLKIAKLQSKATLSAGWLGAGATIVAVLLTFTLGFFIGSFQTKEPNDQKGKTVATSTTSQSISTDAKPMPPVSVIQVGPPKPLGMKPVGNNTQNASQPDAKPKP